ncbi:MAG: putative ski2-type helicase [Candidatus Heimdallarchaeota archaeon LC_2]|nr:MAG: putative ski2-type helicase [Candidatus Heimdallarchaeota archaeon LC_2]
MISPSYSPSDFNAVDNILRQSCLSSLNQLQVKVINDGLLEDQNFLISIPTGSGKTLLTIIKSEEIIKRDQRIIYLTPTRALNKQIYEEFRTFFSNTYYVQGKMKPSIVSVALKNFQVLVSTLEKFEIELRKNPNFIDDVGLIIVDEVHLLSDLYRGPSYEFIISILLYLQQQDRWGGNIFGLSGSIHNPNQIACWMKAGYSHSNERLNPYLAYVADINIENNELLLYSRDNEENEFLTDRILIDRELSHQSSIFNLEKLMKIIPEKYITTILICLRSIKKQQRVLILCSTQLETKVLNSYLLQSIETLNWLKINSLYHHANIPEKQKKIVELLCREGSIDCIFGTTTFAMGVDYPFDAVILTFRSLYDKLFHWKDNDIKQNEKLSISQILMLQQIIGRTGHQPSTTSLVYCIGETLEEGFDIYHKAIEISPSLVSNFNSYFGKMKFQQILNDGCVAGWFNNFQDLIDFSNLSFFLSPQQDRRTLEPNQDLISTRKSIFIDEINNFLANPLIQIKYQNNILENKILMIRHLIQEVNLDELEISLNPAMCDLSKMSISPKQILDFLVEFNGLYTQGLIRIDNIAGIVKLIVKTDPKIIPEMAKMKRVFGQNRYDDIDIQQLSKILSQLKHIDYYLSNDSVTIKPNKAELQLLRKIRNLLNGFQQVVNEQISDGYLFSDKTVEILPHLQLQITSAYSHFDKIIRMNPS